MLIIHLKPYDVAVTNPWPLILVIVISLLIFTGFVVLITNNISPRKWRNQEFLRKRKRKLKKLPRKNEEREKFFKNEFTKYKERTSNIDNYSKNLEEANRILGEKKEDIISLKLRPLEYRDDLKNINNQDIPGFGNSRIYQDEYKNLREFIKSESKIKDIKPNYHRSEAWKDNTDILLFSRKERKILLFEHESGLELYFHYAKEITKELLVDFIKDLIEKVIEDYMVELLDEIIEIIDDHIKKKKKGKNVDRVNIPDKFCIELRIKDLVFKTLKKKRKKKKKAKISIQDQLKKVFQLIFKKSKNQ